MNYTYVSDCLWYLGHILTGISVFADDDLPMRASLVIVGQTITMISRPLGRMQDKARLSNEDVSFV